MSDKSAVRAVTGWRQSARQPSPARVSPPPPVQGAIRLNDITNPSRRICFGVSLGLVYLQFSMIHQTLAGLLHANLYLMYVFGLPPLLGLLLTGGFKYAFGGRPALYWCGFALWITLAMPFSSWKGGSFQLWMVYLRTDLPMLLIVAGLTLTWKECEKLMRAAAFGAVTDLLTARFFQGDGADDYGGRLGLQTGTVSNPNDFAGHLILALSFLLWAALAAKSKVVRILAFCGLLWGLVIVLKTGSRGAEVSLAAALLVYFLCAETRQKIALAIALPVILVGLLAVLPPETLRRLQSFTADQEAASAVSVEAVESSMSREYLLRKSLEYTFRFPLLGVGPGQFSYYEGSNNRVGGTEHGSWHDTHNSYTQASSECGVPGGLLFILGNLSTILLFKKTRQLARAHPDCKDIENAALCVFVGTCAFCVAIFFLNFAYFFYEPFLGGLAIAFWRAAKEEIRTRSLAASAPRPRGSARVLPRRKAPLRAGIAGVSAGAPLR